MLKYVILVTLLILVFFLLAEPAMALGKRISKRFKNIADDVDSPENTDD